VYGDQEFRIKEAGTRLGITALGTKEMRFWPAAGLLLVVCAASGLAQQSNTFKVRHSSPPEKSAKKQPVILAKTKGPDSAASANSKDLQSIEHEKVTTSHSGANKTPALKPIKDKPSPPMNFGGTSSTKSSGMTHQNANPYAGRLKQKYSHQ
jgi:hypothetical protein